MIKTTKVSENKAGQKILTLPKKIAKQLEIKGGDRLLWYLDENTKVAFFRKENKDDETAIFFLE